LLPLRLAMLLWCAPTLRALIDTGPSANGALAYGAFFRFIGLHQDKSGGDAADDLFDADGSFRLARKATIASAIMWAIGSLVAAYVLYYLYRK
jgi:hypothetical protein